MAESPALKDWRSLVEEQLNKVTYAEADILKIMYICQDYLGEIQPIGQWVGQQEGFVRQMHHIFSDMYFTMFGKQPPPRPTEAPITEVLLDTPESRKQAIREVALSITKPGDDVSDEAVFEELKRRGMKIDAFNPTATISTILNGFKPQFEKVQGKRGVFRRQQ
ncbi:MAG: hypothetical protein Q8O05_04465 [Chloroflexota bacterium]|nr:hypothetical protein [Chloroflexota bacterium]